MHDPEKSASGIVAMKPMNKAGRPAAELAEPRPGTKGNADQQSTHRTQSRARVTQALDRVRKAARHRKKEQVDDWLPQPRILHPWPDVRFDVRHPRGEPDALIGQVRICAGGGRRAMAVPTAKLS